MYNIIKTSIHTTLIALLLSCTMVSFTSAATSYESDARSKITEVESQIADLITDMATADAEDIDIDDAEDALAEGVELLADAEGEFAKEDFDDALEEATVAYELLEDALAELGDELTEALGQEAVEMIDEAKEYIDSAEDLLEDIDDDHRHYNPAFEFFEAAEVLLESAEDALDDEKYTTAEEDAGKAIDAIQDFFDELNFDYDEYVEYVETEEILDEAEDAYDDAASDIEEAEDNDIRIIEEKELLKEAGITLRRAQTALINYDYDDVLEYASEIHILTDRIAELLPEALVEIEVTETDTDTEETIAPMNIEQMRAKLAQLTQMLNLLLQLKALMGI